MDNERKKSLNDILEEYQKIENELINSNGEISSDVEQKLDLHELEEQGLRVEQVVEITEKGARPLNKLALKVTDDWAIL